MAEVRKRPAHYKIGKKLKRALGCLMEGRTVTEAARIAQMTPRGLIEALKRPNVLVSVTGEARARLTALLGKGVATIDKVMDSDNPMAALNASKFALAVHQIAPPERGGVMVTVNAGTGYVIDLREDKSAPLTVAEQDMLSDMAARGSPGGVLGGGRGRVIEHDEREVVPLPGPVRR